MHARTMLAVVLAALLGLPAAAAAQARRSAPRPPPPPATAPAKTIAIGAFLGYEMGDLDGFVLRADGEVPIQHLSPQILLSGVGSIGFSHLTDSAFGVDLTANILKVVPAARFTLPVAPALSFYGDAGLGLYWASVKSETTFFGTTISASDSSLGVMMRFGVGGLYQVNPRTKLGAELQLDPMFGDYDDQTFSILVGLNYQL